MYLNLKEAAELLRLEKETVRLKFKNGTIPGAFQTNGERGDWRISREDLENWIRARQVHG